MVNVLSFGMVTN